MIVLYDSNIKSFDNLGLGVLRDFKSEPEITEVLNGLYNLEFDYAKKGWLSEYLIEGNILKANNQLFRIWNIKKNTQDTKITILAKHIWFDLEKNNFLEDVAPTKKTGTSALIWILEHAIVPTNFKISGDVSNIASARYVRMNPIEAIYKADNCLLNVFGGELELDNFNITLHNKRGKDLGLEIRQNKNLKGAECEIDLSSLATRIMPIGNDGILLPEKYIDSPLINNYHAPFFYKYEVNVGVDEENNITLEDCYETMRNEVRKLFDEGIDKPSISISIDFIELSKTKEYEIYSSLETAHLGDQCKVYIPELNLNLSTRIVKTVYNCSKRRITKIELGVPKINFVSNQSKKENSIKNTLNKVNPTTILEKVRNEATELINHPFKGYIYISEETGEMYLMDTNDVATSQKIWKFGLGGIGYSSTGINGPYQTAITSNGEIVADFITVGQISTDRIEGMNELTMTVNKKLNFIELNEGTNQLELQNSLEYQPVSFNVQGNSGKVIYLHSKENNLYPSDNLYPLGLTEGSCN